MPRRPTARRATTSSRRTGTPSTSRISGLKEVKVPAEWANATTERAEPVKVESTEYFENIIKPILAQEGDKLPVSALRRRDGIVPTGTTKFEKRGIAVDVPEWNPDELHPVQPVRHGLPARLHPSLSC